MAILLLIANLFGLIFTISINRDNEIDFTTIGKINNSTFQSDSEEDFLLDWYRFKQHLFRNETNRRNVEQNYIVLVLNLKNFHPKQSKSSNDRSESSLISYSNDLYEMVYFLKELSFRFGQIWVAQNRNDPKNRFRKEFKFILITKNLKELLSFARKRIDFEEDRLFLERAQQKNAYRSLWLLITKQQSEIRPKQSIVKVKIMKCLENQHHSLVLMWLERVLRLPLIGSFRLQSDRRDRFVSWINFSLLLISFLMLLFLDKDSYWKLLSTLPTLLFPVGNVWNLLNLNESRHSHLYHHHYLLLNGLIRVHRHPNQQNFEESFLIFFLYSCFSIALYRISIQLDHPHRRFLINEKWKSKEFDNDDPDDNGNQNDSGNNNQTAELVQTKLQ